MQDPFGRPITYLRVSVTDRCDFRCIYCMPEHMSFLPRADVLPLQDMERLCLAFVGLGVERLRITGGEHDRIDARRRHEFADHDRHIGRFGGEAEISLLQPPPDMGAG